MLEAHLCKNVDNQHNPFQKKTMEFKRVKNVRIVMKN